MTSRPIVLEDDARAGGCCTCPDGCGGLTPDDGPACSPDCRWCMDGCPTPETCACAGAAHVASLRERAQVGDYRDGMDALHELDGLMAELNDMRPGDTWEADFVIDTDGNVRNVKTLPGIETL